MDWLLDGTDTSGWERFAVLGSPWLLIPGTLVLAIVVGFFEVRVGIAIVVASLLGSVLGVIVGNVVDRPPPLADGAIGSFPSLDVVQTGVFWGLVVLTAWWLGAPKLVWQVTLELSIVITLLVSINLIVSGEHWPSDAAGSLIVVAIALIFAASIFETFAPGFRKTKENTDAQHVVLT